MNSLAKSDIFFVITTFAVIVVSIAVIVASIYIVNILKDLKYISKKVKAESDKLSEDLGDLRHHIKTRGASLVGLAGLFKKIVDRRKRSKK